LIADVREIVPEVPVTVTVDVLEAAPAEAVSVRVDVALPPAGGVTEPGEKEAVTPLGRGEAESETAELKPLMLVTVMVLVPLEPAAMVSEAGDAETEKLGVGEPPQEGNLNDPTRVLQLKVPLLFRYSVVYQNVQSSLGSMVMLL
jgi:hypothetical protein